MGQRGQARAPGRAFASCLAAAGLFAACISPATGWKEALAEGRRAAEGRRLADAERALAKANRLADAFGPDDPRRVESLQALASFRLGQGELAEAEELYAKAARLVAARLGEGRVETSEAFKLLGDVQSLRERHDRALDSYRRALASSERAFGDENLLVIPRLYDVALTLQALGKAAEAEPLLKRALAVAEAKRGPDHPEVASRLSDLARLYQAQERFAEAAPLYRRMLALLDKTLADNPLEQVPFLQGVALFEEARGGFDESERLFKRTISILEKEGVGDLRLETALSHYASLLRRRDRGAEAEPLERRAAAVRGARKVAKP